MRILFLLAVMFFAVPTFGQEGQLKSVLVPSQSKQSENKDHPDAPEPKPNARHDEEDVSVVEQLPQQAGRRNPIPGLEPIPAPQPNRGSVSASPVSAKLPSPEATKEAPTQLTLRVLGLTMVPNSTRVRGVVVGSAAEKAGVRPGDMIEAVNSTPVNTSDAVGRSVSSQTNDFDMIVLRGGRRYVARVATQPPPRAARRRIPAQRVSANQAVRATASPASTATTPAQNARTPRTSRPVRRSRPPLIGDGGRIIGNGRVINSFRRVLGLD